MLHACVRRFDVMGTVDIFLETKQGITWVLDFFFPFLFHSTAQQYPHVPFSLCLLTYIHTTIPQERNVHYDAVAFSTFLRAARCGSGGTTCRVQQGIGHSYTGSSVNTSPRLKVRSNKQPARPARGQRVSLPRRESP